MVAGDGFEPSSAGYEPTKGPDYLSSTPQNWSPWLDSNQRSLGSRPSGDGQTPLHRVITNWRWRWDSNPRSAFTPDGFQDRYIKPDSATSPNLLMALTNGLEPLTCRLGFDCSSNWATRAKIVSKSRRLNTNRLNFNTILTFSKEIKK